MSNETQTTIPEGETAPLPASADLPTAAVSQDDVPPIGPIPADDLLFSMNESQAANLYIAHGFFGARSHDEMLEQLQAKRDAEPVPQPIEIVQVGDDGFYAVNQWPEVALVDELVFDGRTIRREGAMVIFSLDNGTAAYVLRDLAVPAAGAMDLQHGSVYRPDALNEAKANAVAPTAAAEPPLERTEDTFEEAVARAEFWAAAAEEEVEIIASEATADVEKVWNIHLQAWV